MKNIFSILTVGLVLFLSVPNLNTKMARILQHNDSGNARSVGGTVTGQANQTIKKYRKLSLNKLQIQPKML